MSQYTKDGGVVPEGIKSKPRTQGGGHYEMFGLYRGVVYRVLYPEETGNKLGRIEYAVRVNGQLYNNAVDMRMSGGVFNFDERVYKHTEASRKGIIDQIMFDADFDGEQVYVMFLRGNGDYPVIIGGAEHPSKAGYHKGKKGDGIYKIEEFNGLEFLIDKDSNYVITHRGRKNPLTTFLSPTPENPEAIDSFIKFHGNGDLEFNPGGDDDSLRMLFTKLTSTFEMFVNGNTITVDGDGVVVEDANGNKVEMKDGVVNIIVNNGDANIEAKNATVTATTKAVIDSPKIELGAGATESVIKGNAFKALYNAHTHGTALGPTTPPVVLMDSVPAALQSSQTVFTK